MSAIYQVKSTTSYVVDLDTSNFATLDHTVSM